MGGRHYPNRKDRTTSHLELDMRYLQRNKVLSAGLSFDLTWTRNGEQVGAINIKTEIDRIILDYNYGSGVEKKSKNYPVQIDWTSCNYGGMRPWFLCPVLGCGRRVAIIYGAPIFSCRHCHELVYATQREDADARALRKANKIRERLKWSPGIVNDHGVKPNGIKPKGMHAQTYLYLTIKHDLLANMVLMNWVASARKVCGFVPRA